MKHTQFGYLVIYPRSNQYGLFARKPEALKAIRAARRLGDAPTLHYGSVDAMSAKAQARVD